MYAKGKSATVPSDAQAREKWVAIFIPSLGSCTSWYVDITYCIVVFIVYLVCPYEGINYMFRFNIIVLNINEFNINSR